MDRPTVGPEEQVKLRIVLRNTSETVFTELTLHDLETPRFEPYQPSTRTHSRDQPLPGGNTAVFRIGLQASHHAGPVTMSARLTWKVGGLPRSAVVTAPEVTITSPWSASQQPRLFFGLGLAKDFALPIVLVLIGVLTNLSLNRRAKRHEASKLILGRVQYLTENHYMQVASAALNLIREHGRLKKASDERDKLARQGGAQASRSESLYSSRLALCFASLLVLLHRDRTLTREAGGWFLLNRHGEEEVQNTWLLFRKPIEKQLVRDDLARLLDALGDRPEKNELIERFVAVKRPRNIHSMVLWHRVKSRFESWVETGTEWTTTILLLQCFTAVLSVEINRIYEPLYGPLEAFPGPDLADYLNQLGEDRDKLARRAEEVAADEKKGTPSADELRERCKALRLYLRDNEPGSRLSRALSHTKRWLRDPWLLYAFRRHGYHPL